MKCKILGCDKPVSYLNKYGERYCDKHLELSRRPLFKDIPIDKSEEEVELD